MINEGDKFFCIKTVIMDEDDPLCDHDIAYIEGKIYKSDLGGSITDEGGDEWHTWHDWENEFDEHFKRMSEIKSKLFKYINV